jgi:Tetratricopeptide repeat
MQVPDSFASVTAELEALFNAGQHSQASRLGAKALVSDPSNQALRLMVAQSLAKSGRTEAAADQYEKLVNGPYQTAARLGLAEIYRRNGHPELAEAIYEQVLAKDPNNKEAGAGLKASKKALSATIDKTVYFGKDNLGFKRFESATRFSKYSEDRSIRWGVGYSLGKDSNAPSADKYASVHSFVQALQWPLTPRLDAHIADGFNKTRLYALVTADLIPNQVSLKFGLVNWGRQSFNASAQSAGLFARHVGMTANFSTELGDFRSHADVFNVSDGNFVWDAQLQFTPVIQPLPFGVQWYAGLSAKRADQFNARYWSPVQTYGLALVGLKKHWVFERGDFGLGLQSGVAITNQARNNFAVIASGKYWISEDMALSLDFNSLKSPRPSDYRQHLLTVNLQRLW